MRKILISGIAAGIVILVLGLVSNFLVSFIWPYDILALPGIRSTSDPLMILFFLHSFVLGIVMAVVFSMLQLSLGATVNEKAKKFGLITWLLTVVPSLFLLLTTMDYPVGFFADSLLGGTLYIFGASWVIARLQV